MTRLLVLLLAGWAVWAQTPADLYTYEEYQAWVSRQPAPVQRSEEILDIYKRYLLDKGLDSVDAETQIRVIRAQEANTPAAPSEFVRKMAGGRKPGKAWVKGAGAEWLTAAGWTVKTGDAALGQGPWDLIVFAGGGYGGKEKAIIQALRPGGWLVVEGVELAKVAEDFKQLRAMHFEQPTVAGRRVTQYCGTKLVE